MAFRNKLLQNIVGCDYSHCFQSQIENLIEILNKLCNNAESGSATIVGPSSCCKLIIDRALQHFPDSLCVVKLHGSLHSNEKLVYKEIERLTDVKLKNFDFEDDDDDCIFSPDVIERILISLKKRKFRGTLFILNQFEKFTTSTHQNFLYNILNNVQTARDCKQTPLFVLCSTSKINANELLEKRVRSRLSQRKLLAFRQYDFSTYLQIAKSCLHSQEHCLKDNKVVNILKNQFYKTKSVEALQQLLAFTVNFAETEKLEFQDFHRASDLLSCEISPMEYLTPLEIDLILAACQYYQKYPDEDFVNFEIIYKEYQMAKKSKIVPKAQIKRVMEKLIEQEIFVPAKNDFTTMNENLPILNLFEFKFLTLQLDRFSVVNFLKKWENCPEETRQWLKQEF